MSLLKYVERLKRMDDLIRRKATGSSQEFASKLGVSQSQLFQDLKEMRELGAPVSFCNSRRSYVYETDGRLLLSFSSEASQIKGGKNIFDCFEHSSIAGALSFNIAHAAL